MALSFRYIGLSWMLFMTLQQMATGLQCYYCNACSSPSGLTTVPNDTYSYSCTKYTAMVAGAVSYVNRGYIFTSACVNSNTVVGGTGITSSCCTTDGCNGSAVFSSSLFWTLVIVALANVVKVIMIN